jgi:glutamate---cysteine ligase / carboxylate-amine ligase
MADSRAPDLTPRAEDLPSWARWSAAGAERPWTVGIEEEVMLLKPPRWAPANRIDDVLAHVDPGLREHLAAETHACVIELRTAPHATVAALAGELVGLRAALRDALAELGLRAAAAGTNPFATAADVRVAGGARYREIEDTMRALARREPTMALHVHVAVPDGPSAVRALDGLRADLPVLLALSANSPYWRATDSGFASIRTPVFAMFPRVGIPRPFGTYATYVRVVETMLRTGAIPDPSYLWWDARLQPRLGTVEIRIGDAVSRVADVATLAALVQCLVRRHAESTPARAPEPEVLAENRFLAARDGMRAELIEGFSTGRRPATARLAEIIGACRPFAAALGCAAEFGAASALGADPGDARQRRVAAREGLGEVPARLSADFAPAHVRLVAA